MIKIKIIMRIRLEIIKKIYQKKKMIKVKIKIKRMLNIKNIIIKKKKKTMMNH